MRDLSFLIVGTPRSGTTLVQRLACELDGVAMPPETHFLGFFALELLRRRRFPIERQALREELEAFAALDKSSELGLDPTAVETALEGRSENLAKMFAAIVETLAGPGRLLGEKSPEHLLWWRPVARALPALRIIGVVREPRAVVASALAVWGDRGTRGAPLHVLRAQRWSSDAREMARAGESLGPSRFLLLRYEDVVHDETHARSTMARFLGSRARVATAAAPPRIVLPREWWKARTFEPITDERLDAWRELLTADQASEVLAICRTGMRRFGYDGAPTRGGAFGRIAKLGPRANIERLRFIASRARHLSRISRTTV
jgi:hypothetical protein